MIEIIINAARYLVEKHLMKFKTQKKKKERKKEKKKKKNSFRTSDSYMIKIISIFCK